MPLGTLPRRTRLLYGLGTVAFGVKDHGFSALLMLFYNQVIGLPATWVGAAIMIAMVVDALFDPLLGQFSDDFRSRLGRRHPFMYAAALPIAISYLFLWSPPQVSPGAQFAWLLVTAIAVRLSISLYEIPSTALLAEFTDDYDERTRLVGARYFFGVLGGIVMTVVTFNYLLRPTPAQPVGQLNAAGYATYAWVAAIVMLLSVIISSLGTQQRAVARPALPPVEPKAFPAILREMGGVLLHPAYISIISASLFFAIASGLSTSLALYLSTYFWELSSAQIATIASSSVVGIILAFVVALPLSRRIGKKHAAMAMFGLSLVASSAPILLRLAGLFPANGDPLLLWLLIVQFSLNIAGFIGGSMLTVSMIADVTDQIQLETGRRSEGLLFSAATMVSKAVSGMGILLSGIVLTLVGFPDHAQPGHVAQGVLDSLALALVAGTLLSTGAAILCLARYPISRALHLDNVQRLGERTARE